VKPPQRYRFTGTVPREIACTAASISHSSARLLKAPNTKPPIASSIGPIHIGRLTSCGACG